MPIFQEFPPSAHQVVVRFVRDRTRSSSAQSFIPAESALSVLKQGGHDSHTMLEASTSVELTSLRSDEIPCDQDAVVLDCDNTDDCVLLETLVEQLGPSKLSLRSSHGFVEKVVLRKCGNLKALQLIECLDRFPFNELLQICSGQLREIDISGTYLFKTHITAMAEYCRDLTTLKLQFMASADDLGPIWVTVGTTLEHLKFWGPFKVCPEIQNAEDRSTLMNDANNYAQDINAIIDSCKQVRELKVIYGSVREDHDHDSLSLLCRLFGPQLRLLSMAIIRVSDTESFVSTIETLSKDAKIAIQLAGANAVNLLPVIKNDIRSLSMCGIFPPVLEEADADIGQVEELSVRVKISMWKSIGNFLSRFFPYGMPFVRVIHFSGTPIDTEELSAISNRVSTLEVFSCMVRELSFHSINNLARANPNLETVVVKMRCIMNRDRLEQASVDIVRAFGICLSLKKLTVSWGRLSGYLPVNVNEICMVRSKKMDEVCAVLRHRNIEVFIYGKHYGS